MLKILTRMVQFEWLFKVADLLFLLADSHQDRKVMSVAGLEGACAGSRVFLLTFVPEFPSEN